MSEDYATHEVKVGELKEVLRERVTGLEKEVADLKRKLNAKQQQINHLKDDVYQLEAKRTSNVATIASLVGVADVRERRIAKLEAELEGRLKAVAFPGGRVVSEDRRIKRLEMRVDHLMECHVKEGK